MCRWLDKKVLGFRQDVRSFFKSKTNVAAIATLIGAGIGYAQGDLDAVQAANLVVPAIIGLFVRDSVVAGGAK